MCEMLTTGDQGESLWYDTACEMKDSSHMCWCGENLQDTLMMGEGGNQVQSTEQVDLSVMAAKG